MIAGHCGVLTELESAWGERGYDQHLPYECARKLFGVAWPSMSPRTEVRRRQQRVGLSPDGATHGRATRAAGPADLRRGHHDPTALAEPRTSAYTRRARRRAGHDAGPFCVLVYSCGPEVPPCLTNPPTCRSRAS